MLLELHCHSFIYSSCSFADPCELVSEAAQKGLQGLVFTDHGYQWTKEELEKLRREHGIDKNFLLFSAQEVNTDFGHIVVYGADKSLPDAYNLADLRRQYPDAAFVWAHPFRKGFMPSDDKLLSKDIDAIEIFSLNQTLKENYLGFKAWRRLKFNAVCGSDAHIAGAAGTFPALFDNPIASGEDLISEIKKGHCRPFYKEKQLQDSRCLVTEVIIGAKGNFERRARMIIKKSNDEKNWNLSKETALAVKNALGADFAGKNYRAPKVYEIDDVNRVTMEEGQHGQQLSKLFLDADIETKKKYFELSAKWLAKLHSYTIEIKNSDIKEIENKKTEEYKKVFSENKMKLGVSSRDLMLDLTEKINKKQQGCYFHKKEKFVFLHGDYCPENIIIGQDDLNDPDSIFVSVIDFNNSLNYLKEYDIGYFLAQYQSRFSDDKTLLENLNEDLFLRAYFGSRKPSPEEISDIMFFKLRAYLSIVSSLKDDSPQMKFIVSDINATLEKMKSNLVSLKTLLSC